jgi:hypothetical protein
VEGPNIVRVRRGLLFWGLFFLALGGIPLLVRAGLIDANVVAGAWRLWPLLLVALGLTLILGRSRAGVLGTVVAALALGAVAGGALAASAPWIGNVGGCGSSASASDQHTERSGTFAGPATVTLDMDCGTLDVGMRSGSDWHILADHRGDPPTIDSKVDALDIHSPDVFGNRRQAWQIELPSDQTRTIDITANASSGKIVLAGATLDTLKAQLNAGDLRFDATEARISQADLSINAGRMRIRTGTDFHGSLSANAGQIELCAPPEVELRIRVQEQLTFAHNLDERGLSRSADVWTRPGSSNGGLVDIDVQGNAANLTLDPDGGC